MKDAPGPRFKIPSPYYVEALNRLQAGTPVSATLREARKLIADRGWARPIDDDEAVGVSIQKAIRLAAGMDPGMPLLFIDNYAWMMPIEAVLGSPIGKWEIEDGRRKRDVLAVLDEAIAFADEAERSPPELLEALRRSQN